MKLSQPHHLIVLTFITLSVKVLKISIKEANFLRGTLQVNTLERRSFQIDIFQLTLTSKLHLNHRLIVQNVSIRLYPDLGQISPPLKILILSLITMTFLRILLVSDLY